MKLLLLTLIRIPLYVFFAWLGVFVIMDAVAGITGLLLAAPLASVAILIDLILTALFYQESVSRSTTRRILLIDSLLADPGKSILERKRLESKEKEELEDGVIDASVSQIDSQVQIGPGRSDT